MPAVNPWAVIVATVASFLAAGGWYALMGSRLALLSDAYANDDRHPGATAAVELGRGLMVSIGVSHLVGWIGTQDTLPAARPRGIAPRCLPGSSTRRVGLAREGAARNGGDPRGRLAPQAGADNSDHRPLAIASLS